MSTAKAIQKWSLPLIFFLYLSRNAFCQTGYVYLLDTEYSGVDFFNGWEFFTASDPTNGFVQYVDQQTALSYGMINSSNTAPAYIGVDYTNKMMPGANGAGRPSVRISTTKVWTHGLFIGDFSHAPGGVCGTWPAWWTLGPNWPYTGEIDILEGVNILTNNVMSLHTSPNYTIAGDPDTETGILQATNCAYYEGGGNGVGCGVADTRNTSYGAGFNNIDGGVYAMQWTSDFIKVWFFPRPQIPEDIINKTPDPSSWGLPAADLIGTGDNVDEHFVDHAIVFDNTFCGDYAGAPGVWDTGDPSTSCAAITGYSSCSEFVGEVPDAFIDSYWSINSVRVYQLIAASSAPSSTSSTSLTPTFIPGTSTAPVPTASTSLCPTYNFTEISYGGQTYEIECGFTLNGDDLGYPYPSYPNPTNFEECLTICNYWTTYNSTTCIGVAYVLSTNGCYPKDKSYGNQVNSGQYAARLIWAGYGDITDAPPTSTTSITSETTSMATSNFSTVTPVHYIDPTVLQSSMVLSTASAQSSILGAGMGVSLTSFYTSSLVLVSSSTFHPSTASTASSMPASTSLLSPSSVLASSSALSSSSVPATELVTLSSSPLSLSQLVKSSSTMSTSPKLLSSSLQASSSASPSSSLALPISIPSEPTLPPSLSALPFQVSSSAPSSPSSQLLSISYFSSTMPISSTIASTSFGSSITMPVWSAPSISFPPQSSPSISPASNSINLVSLAMSPSNTTPALVTTSTTEPPENGDATNYVGFTSTSTPPPSPPAATDEGNAYAGCLSYPVGSSGFRQVEESLAMTIEQCLSDCFESFYAGVYGQFCYCGTTLDAIDVLTQYPESDCNTPCPGNPSETCGGDFTTEMSHRRQSVILLTTYNNTANINAAEPSSSTFPSSNIPTSTVSFSDVVIPLTTIPSSTISATAEFLSSSIMSLSSSSPFISGVAGASSILTSASPVGGSQFFDPGTPLTTAPSSLSSSLNLSSSAQSIPIVISTVWVDVCDVCEHGLTTMATTITTLHCACTGTPVPTIPMTTSTKACAVCGKKGTQATVIVTCPDITAIIPASEAVSLPAATRLIQHPGSTPGEGIGPTYGNSSVPMNETTNPIAPGEDGDLAPSGSGPIQASAAGNGGATPVRSSNLPLMTNSTAASGSGPYSVNGAGGVMTVNASVVGPTETLILKFSNGANAVWFNIGSVLFGFLIVILMR